MEPFRFPLRNEFNCDHTEVNDLIFLEADGSYTKVHHRDRNGQISMCLQSGHLKKFSRLLDHGFVRLSRKLMVNLKYVASHSRERIVTLSTGHTFTFSKKLWPKVKRLLSKQLIIPFGESS
jgi:DNA-binding LytR/AlgR family response regulator